MLTIGADGSYSYHPNENIDNATDVQDVFTYTVTDGLATVQTTLTITVAMGRRSTHGNAITLDVDEAALSTVGATGSEPRAGGDRQYAVAVVHRGSDNLTSFAFSQYARGSGADLNGDGAQIFSGIVSPTRRSWVTWMGGIRTCGPARSERAGRTSRRARRTTSP